MRFTSVERAELQERFMKLSANLHGLNFTSSFVADLSPDISVMANARANA